LQSIRYSCGEEYKVFLRGELTEICCQSDNEITILSRQSERGTIYFQPIRPRRTWIAERPIRDKMYFTTADYWRYEKSFCSLTISLEDITWTNTEFRNLVMYKMFKISLFAASGVHEQRGLLQPSMLR